jgi:hypothetical protein
MTEKFEIGDKVVCVKNLDFYPLLKLDMIYNVVNHYYEHGIYKVTVFIDGWNYIFPNYCFVSIPQYRRMKIEKIMKNIGKI